MAWLWIIGLKRNNWRRSAREQARDCTITWENLSDVWDLKWSGGSSTAAAAHQQQLLSPAARPQDADMAVLQAVGAATNTNSALAGPSRPEEGHVEVEQDSHSSCCPGASAAAAVAAAGPARPAVLITATCAVLAAAESAESAQSAQALGRAAAAPAQEEYRQVAAIFTVDKHTSSLEHQAALSQLREAAAGRPSLEAGIKERLLAAARQRTAALAATIHTNQCAFQALDTADRDTWFQAHACPGAAEALPSHTSPLDEWADPEVLALLAGRTTAVA